MLKLILPIDLTLSNTRVIYCDELPFGILTSNHYFNIDTMNITSCDAGEERLFEKKRDEYIVDLTNYVIDRMKKETNIKELNIDDNVLFKYLFSIFDTIMEEPH